MLELAGEDDWRLPTRAELESIVDFGRTGPALNLTAFPSTPSSTGSYWWTASPVARSTTSAWGINTHYGWADPLPLTGSAYVRCVRSPLAGRASSGTGGTPPGRFVVNLGGWVQDTRTGLVWLRSVEPKRAYADAETLCAGITSGGGGWRLPKISELLTLVDPTRNPVIDTNAFQDVPSSGLLWTQSVSVGGGSNYRWMVNVTGASIDDVRTDSQWVICVH